MPHLRLATVRNAAIAGVLAGTTWLCTGCGTAGAAATAGQAVSKAENDAVATAATVYQYTAQHVQNIPQLVYDMATAILNANNQSSWGRPEAIVVTDTDYVFLYPTPAAERQRTGVPRTVVIKRTDKTDSQS